MTHRNRVAIGLLVLAMLASATILLLSPPTRAQSSGDAIVGYAWSDTIGWIDLHCSNTESCDTNSFGLTVAEDGTISGYAWSDNIGWISANTSDMSGCPSGECSARISSSALEGWMRALAADGDGWDGWISLSGTDYGPTISGGAFEGYSWGSDVVGWVDWSLAFTNYTPCSAFFYCVDDEVWHQDANCEDTLIQTCSYQCASGACVPPPAPEFNSGESDGGLQLTGHLQASPTLVPFGFPTLLFWNLSNVESCTVTGTNGDSWTAISSGSSGVQTSGIVAQTDFTLECIGLDESEIEETVTIFLIPIFNEF